jgi:polysaccharide biosynthesis protein PslH
MRVLILCNKSPWPPREGGPMAMNMFAEGLLENGHQVRVLAMNTNKYHVNPDEIPAGYRNDTRLELVDVDLSLRKRDALRCLITGKSYHIERFISRDFRDNLERILREEEFDIVQFEMIYMAPYLSLVRHLSGARCVLRAHNIENRIWERIALQEPRKFKRWYLRQLYRSLRRYEETVIRDFDGIVAITAQDSAWFREAVGRKPGLVPSLTHIPFGIDVEDYPYSYYPEKPTLFSIGAMNWIPNSEGIRWFLDNVWPDLHSAFPDLKYHIAGREMPGWMKETRLPGVVIEGEVPDARDFMSDHSIMIVPLFSGSGIRIKIIEGMASSRAVVSTSVGAEGISYTEGKDILIADSACDFFEGISNLLSNPDRIRKTGFAARETATTYYDRDYLINRLEAFYRSLGS